MAEISTALVLEGVTRALHTAFPEGRVFIEEAEQVPEGGDFLVRVASARQTTRGPARWRCEPALDVAYFPKGGKGECHNMADALFSLLEYITTEGGDLLRGGRMAWAISEGVLHVGVTYPYQSYREHREEAMEELKLGGKNGW